MKAERSLLATAALPIASFWETAILSRRISFVTVPNEVYGTGYAADPVVHYPYLNSLRQMLWRQ